MTDSNAEGIAIIGVAGKFPGAANVDEFWRNLVNGVESISTFNDEELAASGLDVAALRNEPGYVAARGILKNAEWFDAAFFGMNPKEAEITDPQQRVFLETSWDALENAGYDPARFPGPIGVYAGMGYNSYYVNNLHSRPDVVDLAGWMSVMMANEKDFLATRVAYKLNLKGPAINVNTACSTSLVAVCQACQSLLNFQCDMALAGGVSITFPQRRGFRFQEGGIVSPDGHCRSFDALAQGTVSSDGVGVVVLKRLAEALIDGDEIYAVIKGFGLNNDGSSKVSFGSPSVDGQAAAIALALGQAGFDPATISYVEAHGTATPLGDPIEIAGLTQAFGPDAPKNLCAIGSVKSNIGHLDTAAGVAGLIKTALALKHKQLPASLHFNQANPAIDFANSPFFVNVALTEWRTNGSTPRRAGVSSFGLGGTNAHVILEETPQQRGATAPSCPWQVLTLSAKTAPALDAATASLAAHFKDNPGANIADAAFTLQSGRAAFDHRRILVCRDLAEAEKALGAMDPKRVLSRQREKEDPAVVFMFPGQGAQYINMGAGLYRVEPVFKETVDHCATILQPHIGCDLRRVIFPGDEEQKNAEQLLHQTRITQPALFVIEYALAKVWLSWGITPRAMIGHSVGEYVAGCLAGIFTLEDALSLVANRARLVQSQPGGAMLALRLPESEVLPLLRDGLALAAVNSANLCVVSGSFDAIKTLEGRLDGKKAANRRLQTSHAFHSSMMDPVVPQFLDLVKGVKLNAPAIPCISNVTAQWMTAAQATDPAYWADHLRQTVRFAGGVGEILKEPGLVLLEIGPGQTLSALATQHPAKTPRHTIVSSLSPVKDQETHAMLSTLGKLWITGVNVDWAAFHQHESRRRIPLPTYPFQRKRYWVEPGIRSSSTNMADTAPTGEISASGPEIQPSESSKVAASPTPPQIGSSRRGRLLGELVIELENLSGRAGAELDPTATFLELGFDSLFLAQASRAFGKKYGINITFRQLMDDLSTLNDLAEHLDEKLPSETSSPAAAQAPSIPTPKPLNPATRPLTDAQMELWLGTQWGESASCALNQVFVLSLQGPLRVDAFDAALQALVQRHEALRTTFLPDGSAQSVALELNLKIAVSDLSALTASQRQEQLAAAARRQNEKLFDLARGPLLRVELVKLSDTGHAAIFAAHHLVLDGWSIGVILQDLGALYTAAMDSTAAKLALATQYSEYSDWERSPENHNRMAKAESYWLQRLANPPSAIELPSDHPRPSNRSHRAAREATVFGEALCQKVKTAAASAGCSLFTYLFATFNVLLHRLAGQNDLVIGIPAAGQMSVNDHGLHGETLVGHCVNLLPFRNHCDGSMRFTDFLAATKRNTLDAFDHQHFTFGNLVKRLNLPRDSSRVPLIPITFNVNRARNTIPFGNIQSELQFPPRSFNFFDLTVDVLEAGSELQVGFHYGADLFDAPTVRRWLDHWKILLGETVANPDRRIDDLPILSQTGLRQLLADGNNTRSDFPQHKCTHELFEEQAKHQPSAVAVVFEDQSLTYAELNDRANRLARQLRKQGVKPGALVGLCVERSLDMAIGLLGILKSGAAYVPLDPTYPQDRLEFILQDAGAAALLTQSFVWKRLSRIRENATAQNLKIICLDSGIACDKSSLESTAEGPAKPQDLAYVLYTSGSTGKPKGVEISHRALVNFLSSMRRQPGFVPSDVLLAVTTLSFDIAGLELWLPLIVGGRVVIASTVTAMNGKKLAAQLSQSGATIMQATPVTWRLLIEAGWQGDPHLKILCGGEAWSKDLARDLLPRCASLWNMYGPTETTIWSAVSQVAGSEPPLIGLPIANTTFYVLDARLQPVPVGVAGELHIGGTGLARGYLNRPELTAEKFITDPFSNEPGARLYKTGDLVRRRPDGKIEFLGRIDHQVKVRGYRIELGEIETHLRQHPNVRDSAVVAKDDASGNKQLVAYLVPRQQPSPTAAELRSFLKPMLPDYMIPAAFMTLAALPLTPNGKLDRKALPQPETREETANSVPPGTAAELALAKLWCEVLGLKSVGIHDNFFDLGGHSLMATQLIARLVRDHDLELSLRDIFDSPTIGAMCKWFADEGVPQTTEMPGSYRVESRA